MKVERVCAAFIAVAGLGGCGVLNGLTGGEVQSPFQNEGESGEGEGEGEGEDTARLTTTPTPTSSLSYQPLRTVDRDVSFELALPEGYAETRYAVIVVSAANPCLSDDLATPLFDAAMAIVRVPAVSTTADDLDDVLASLEHDIGLDDSQTFAVVAGEASRNLAGSRVGDRAAPALVLLSPSGLPPLLDPDERSDATTIFATTSDVSIDAMATTNDWPVERIDGINGGCAMLDRTHAETEVLAGIMIRDLLLTRPQE